MAINRNVLTTKFNVLHSRARWVCMDDPVMGGKSFSRNFYNEGSETQVFSGNVSTKNNGGFCSSWFSLQRFLDLSACTGIYIDAVALQERTFGIMLRDKKCEGVYYYSTFHAAPVGSPSFKRTYIPFSTMTPRWRGQNVNRGPILRNCIAQIGLMSTKEHVIGNFELYIKEIGGYAER